MRLRPFLFFSAMSFEHVLPGPEIEPEVLHLLAGSASIADEPLADGRLPVHARGKCYLMTPESWAAYRGLCASRAVMTAQLEGDAV
jgi:hypothetical protein